MSDFDYEYSEDEQAEYIKYLRYRLEEVPEDQREEYYQLLQSINYDHSNNPRQDAELNFRRAKDRLRQKRKAERLPDAAQSFVKFKMQEDNLDEKQTLQWIKRVMKEGE